MKGKLYQLIYRLAPASIKWHLERFKLGYELTATEGYYLVETGYVHTALTKSLQTEDGAFLPWMNFTLIDLLKKRLRPDLRVFEYGSGASTVFFAERTQAVTSIEYDKGWYEQVQKTLEEHKNSDLHFIPLTANYTGAIEDIAPDATYDLIIIDGRERVECAKKAIPFLSERGVLLFDDSHRPRYQEGLDFYKEKGFRELPLTGLKPGGLKIDQTSILYRDNNCLGL